jgi:hypothetical protein
LQHIYGRLNPPNRGQVAGSVKSFDQSVYTKPHQPDALSLGDTGYVFVPQDCEQGGPCRVHVALHGCKQDIGDIGRRFVVDTGYNAWADTNHLIVLYPQTKPSPYLPTNPQACWDWWSYIDHEDSYVTKSGSQVKADTTVQSGMAPEGLAAIDTSDTAADLVWYPVTGATTYRVSRAGVGGTFQKVGDVIGASFGDSGLMPQSNYRWHVSAIVNGVLGPPSADAIASTRAAPPPCNTPGSCPINK